ncbi:MAG TPA: nitrate- and nitrite sensing domain-containing protein [Streptosporangiaceae bacterium]|nr:nitrate- and nitrite sensing domain-containing protein [Streptosporangiaceae bacterium]
MIGLYAFVLYTTVGNAINLDRGPNLINRTSVPAAKFDIFVQDERRASLVYLAAPTPANKAQLQAAQAATAQAFPAFQSAMTSPATTQAATTGETAVVTAMLGEIEHLPAVRDQVNARTISPAQAFNTYSHIISDELQLFIEENHSLTDAHSTTQSLAVIDTTEAREALLQEDSLLSAALAAKRLTPATRVQFTELAGARKVKLQDGDARFLPPNLAVFNANLNKYAPASVQNQLTSLENAVAADPGPSPPFTAAQWNPVVKAVATGYFYGGVNESEFELGLDHNTTNAAWRRVALSGGLGLLGLILSILVSFLIGRRIIRRLGRLQEAADTLANEQLPDVVARLRRGEDVPIEAAAPTATTDFGNDEIGQVGRSFEQARQTAIEAAVGEARLRRGINDVFRNLARRSQSLLHRQLTTLDAMERRTTDPEALEDLFRLDHLTTRMRRHSEGLIILSGAAPGRGWVHPVRMIDVLRGAAAEVEDYSRVTVTCPSQAALTGPAVADVIHMLAELIENATTLSPPYTPVRVTGDLVANGFAIEIEDRGLGMSEQRFAELNARLAQPPEFDVFNSEQLGLFVVGQLAKRHGIRVTLRPSPFGGTTAIALIPTELVGLDENYAQGMPALSSSWNAGHQAAGDDVIAQPAAQQSQLTGGQPWGALPQGSSPANGSALTGSPGTAAGQPPQDPFDNFGPGPGWGAPEFGSGSPANGTGLPAGTGTTGASPAGQYGGPAQPTRPYSEQPYSGQSFGGQSFGGGQPAGGSRGSAIDWAGPGSGSRGPSFGGTGPAGGPAGPADGMDIGSAGSEPTETGLPWPYDRPAPTPNGQPAGAGFGGTAYPDYSPPPVEEPAFPPAAEQPFPQAEQPFPQAEVPYPAAEPPFRLQQPREHPEPREPGYPAEGAEDPQAESYPQAGTPLADDEPAQGEHPYPDETYKGLPRRVRQANLAPQLRDKPTVSDSGSPSSEAAMSDRSPEEIRSALSAIQRGWQRGQEPADNGNGGLSAGDQPAAVGADTPDTPGASSSGATEADGESSRDVSADGNEDRSHLGGSDDT